MQKAKNEKILNVVNIILIILLSITFILPVFYIISASLSTSASFARYGYTLIPKTIDFYAYKYVLFTNKLFLRSVWNSIFITVVGTFLMIATSCLYSYALIHDDFVGKKFFSVFAIFTMLFAGGTIPYYLVVRGLGLENTVWAVILPGSVSAWNILLTRNFFYTLPKSMLEASELDSANHFQTLFKVVMPTSFPVIASGIVFTSVGFWNNWFGPLLFIDKAHRNIAPIQAILREMVESASAVLGGNNDLPTEAIKNASVVVATLPIIIIYPILQKYFINGVVLGSVKE